MDSKEKCLTLEKTDKEAPLLVLRYAPWVIISVWSLVVGFLAMYVWIEAFHSGKGIFKVYSGGLIFFMWTFIMISRYKIWFMDSLKLYRDRIEKTYRFVIKPDSFFFENNSITIADRIAGPAIRVTPDNNRLGMLGHTHIYYFSFSRDNDIDLKNFIDGCKSVGVEVKEAPSSSISITKDNIIAIIVAFLILIILFFLAIFK